jgi:hypothetical protein
VEQGGERDERARHRYASRAVDAYAEKQRVTELREEGFTTGFLVVCALAAFLLPGRRRCGTSTSNNSSQ